MQIFRNSPAPPQHWLSALRNVQCKYVWKYCAHYALFIGITLLHERITLQMQCPVVLSATAKLAMAVKNNYNHRVTGSFLALKTPQNLKIGQKLTDLTYFSWQLPSKLDLYSSVS